MVTFHKILLGDSGGKHNVESKSLQPEAGFGVGSLPFVRQPLPTAFTLLGPLPVPTLLLPSPISSFTLWDIPA